ncbi:hypothetical protein GW17_00022994 [Ensete ventricosum]|nr:hypothetical protein GW17_00022994 [Ensete ventricosum]RZR83306.1 hypothetical protein BHM03_00009903 [Ensete ventricosum]
MHGDGRSFRARELPLYRPTSMVSLQAALYPEDRKACPDLEEDSLRKKRKSRDGDASEDDWFVKEAKFVKAEEADDIRFNLDAPLPLEWQRCLDLQIHFYNTRTHRRTSRDPRLHLETPPSSPLSLDLELNLACEPPRSHIDGGGREEERRKQGNSGGNPCSLSWMSLDADPDEMVATVCMRCHMLVMMNKATLSCPNCKFIHPPDHGSSTSIKPGFKLLCCKD